MVNYQNGKIYKLVSDNSDKVYYGSTTKKLYDRKAGHMYCYRKYLEGDKSRPCSSFEVIKEGDLRIVLLENYPCEDKSQLIEREMLYIKNNPCVNKKIPTRTKKQWYEDNKEKLLEKQSTKYTCSCGSVIRRSGKAEHEKSNKHIKQN